MNKAEQLAKLCDAEIVRTVKLDVMHSDIAALLRSQAAEIEALRADAERYRWLRAKTTGYEESRGRQSFDLPDPHPLGNIMRGSVAQHLDAAIDAAITKERLE